MLEYLLGSVNKERVLLFLFVRKKGYAREIASFYETDISPIQNQLNKLEIGNILFSNNVGKTKVFELNPRYPFFNELNQLLEKLLVFMSTDEKNNLVNYRTRPRRSGKPL